MQRLQELRDRGVLSLNWRVDRQLSTPTAAVFVNYHTQMVVVAFRGSVTLGDWASNAKTVLPPLPTLALATLRHPRSRHPLHPRLKPLTLTSPLPPSPLPSPPLHPNQVLPGDYANSRSFQASLTVARRARRKYVLFSAIRLTGHSRGGSMADYVGRELGLPSLQINPGSWGKLFREEQVATALHPRLHPRPSPPSPFTTLALHHPRPSPPSRLTLSLTSPPSPSPYPHP